jgi:hypothetical protein
MFDHQPEHVWECWHPDAPPCPACDYAASVRRQAAIAATFATWDERTTAPDTGKPVTAPNYSPRAISGRTMTSPLTVATDYDVSGFPLTTPVGAIGFPVIVTAPSGSTREFALSDHAATMGHHASRVTRSRKGRTSFVVDAKRRGRLHAPITDEPSGLAAASSIDLVKLADVWLRRHDDDDGTWRTRIAGAESRGYLVGSHDASFAQVTPSLLLRGGTVANGKVHAATLADGCGMRGDAYGVAVHTADLAGWLGGFDRAYLTSAERDHDGRLIRRASRLVLTGTPRRGETDGWTRLADTGKAPPQYVRVRADGVTDCLAWHDRIVVRDTRKVTMTGDAATRFVAWRHGRGRFVVAVTMPARVIVRTHASTRTRPTDHAWHGHTLTPRPIAAKRSRTTATTAATTTAKRDPRVIALAAEIRDALTDGSGSVTIGSVSVRLAATTQGRHAVSVTGADGAVLASWTARSLGAVAIRALALAAQ